MSVWIWKFGEFEIYHNRLLHERRIEYGYPEPPFWHIYPNECFVRFTRVLNGETGAVRIKACGRHHIRLFMNDGKQVTKGDKSEFMLTEDVTRVEIKVYNNSEFPCIYTEGAIETDDKWLCDCYGFEKTAPGCYACFDAPDKLPTVFPFEYTPVKYTSREERDGGTLFTYERETFARTSFHFAKDGCYNIRFGESLEETLDPEFCVIRGEHETENCAVSFGARAFRFIFVDSADVDVEAEYEFIPLEYKGSFSCDEPLFNRIWQLCAYTFHLNTREFFLDGIKRDRWVWSGDAYQSLFVNRSLFCDPLAEQRTLIALGGKLPFEAHINTIMDYTYLWVLALYEHYITYGDKKFLEAIYPQADAIMSFCLSRLCEDGFTRGKPGDWVFIDWASLDKTGALCGEQILLAAAMEKFAYIASALGKDRSELNVRADALQQKIKQLFYDAEKHAYIDSYESGKRFVTRHTNLLAYLYLPLSADEKREIYENVILNDDVPQITTPYFKFFENTVHCEAGNLSLLEASLTNYYGAMLATGATTIYEQFDPTQSGTQHYAMYGGPYLKSLCHAWSTSPIYLLARYRAGVKNTGIAYSTFEVAPCRGSLNDFECTVPMPTGCVKVSMKGDTIKVYTDAPGGTLVWNGESKPLEPGREEVIRI